MDRFFRKYIPASWLLSWILFILILPITSLPILAHWVGSDVVAAPSAVILLWLVFTWFLPRLMKGGSISSITLPLIAFVLIAGLATAISFFVNIPPFKDKSLVRQTLPALLTLGIGITYYLITATWVDNPGKLKTTLFWINISGGIILIWSLLQAGVFWVVHDYPPILNQIQTLVSLHELYPQRVTGFAFEPSWLAHQLNMLYLPFWLAESVVGYSAYRLRVWRFTIENFLLAAGILTLYLSVSRVGWVAFALMIGCLLLAGTIKLVGRMKPWVLALFHIDDRWSGIAGGLITFILLLAILIAGSGLIYLMGLIASHYESRMARLFNIPKDIQGFNELATYLVVASRLFYWDTGWLIFNDHPLIGVGLGNAGFYFPTKLPAFGWNLIEVQQIFYNATFLPNIKSLWVRLLAETGILGFILFIVWQYLLAQAGRFILHSREPILKMVGLAGILVIIGLLIEGFSIDSFALPYFWVSLGLLTASVGYYQKSIKHDLEDSNVSIIDMVKP